MNAGSVETSVENPHRVHKEGSTITNEDNNCQTPWKVVPRVHKEEGKRDLFLWKLREDLEHFLGFIS